jgi:hypothetical protein
MKEIPLLFEAHNTFSLTDRSSTYLRVGTPLNLLKNDLGKKRFKIFSNFTLNIHVSPEKL